MASLPHIVHDRTLLLLERHERGQHPLREAAAVLAVSAKLRLRHSTAGRIARSAALLVGSTPRLCAKVHNAAENFSKRPVSNVLTLSATLCEVAGH